MIADRKNVALYLPESFEWLILSSGILKKGIVTAILRTPYDYVESEKYFSWERFFTAILINETKDTYMAYLKRKLNPAYLSDTVKEAIFSQMINIRLDWKTND